MLHIKLEYLNYFFYFNKFFKLNLFLTIIYVYIFITSLYSYSKQLVETSKFTKFFILNENEKEIDSADDIFFFYSTICFNFIFVYFLFIFFFYYTR